MNARFFTIILAILVACISSDALCNDCASGSSCSVMEENHRGSPNAGVLINNTNNFYTAQSFKPQKNYTLCKVEVYIDTTSIAASACTVTLYIDTSYPYSGSALTSKSINTVASKAQWYCFDVPDISLTQNTTYYIRLQGNATCANLWSAVWNPSSDPYPRGVGYPTTSYTGFYDYLFATYRQEDPDGYGCSISETVDFGVTSGTFEPGSTVTLNATNGIAQLCKHPTCVDVDLSYAQLAINIGPNETAYFVDVNGVTQETRQISQFTVTSLEGGFDAYEFGGIPVGASTFQIYGPSGGTIVWDSNTITCNMSIVASATGFVDIHAEGFGTALINTGTNSVELQLDSKGVEIIPSDIPTLTEWGLIVMVILLFALGAVMIQRKSRPVTG